MSDSQSVSRILDSGIVAIIRAPTGEQLVDVAKAIYEGGIDVIEVTCTVPGILEIISDVRKALGDKILLGAGTVLDPETARAVMLAGAEFLVCPTVNTDVIRISKRYGKAVLPGAFTPTEVLTAWESGADIVKLFPAEVGGPGLIKMIHGPLPQVRILPTGGVSLETLPAYIKAGACAVGLGSTLVEKDALANGDMERIRSLSAQYVELVKTTRQSMRG